MNADTEWSAIRASLNQRANFPRPKRGQIWWCALGPEVGSEQSNRVGFERPVLVIKVFGTVFWGLPITRSDPWKSKKRSALFYMLEDMTYENQSGETKVLTGYVALSQLRTFDARRLSRKILKLDAKTGDAIVRKLKGFM